MESLKGCVTDSQYARSPTDFVFNTPLHISTINFAYPAQTA